MKQHILEHRVDQEEIKSNIFKNLEKWKQKQHIKTVHKIAKAESEGLQ